MASKVIPLSKIKKIDIVNIKGGMTASQIMSKYKPDALVNLALYDVGTGVNIVNLVDENIPSGYLFSSNGIGITGSSELLWTTFEKAKADNNIRDFVAGAPTLVQNGKVSVDWGNKYSSYIDGVHKRMAVGFNDSNLILLATDGSTSIPNLAKTCVEGFGAKYMINCDGGGSCHLQVGSKIYAKSSRANASWLLIYLLEDNEMKVQVDGKEYIFESINKDGFTYVKLRDFEQAGYQIGYVNGIPTIDKPKEK